MDLWKALFMYCIPCMVFPGDASESFTYPFYRVEVNLRRCSSAQSFIPIKQPSFTARKPSLSLCALSLHLVLLACPRYSSVCFPVTGEFWTVMANEGLQRRHTCHCSRRLRAVVCSSAAVVTSVIVKCTDD